MRHHKQGVSRWMRARVWLAYHWLRERVIPWRVLAWMGRARIWCWADLVSWKLGGTPWGDVKRNSACLDQYRDGPLTCYCGFWDHREGCRARGYDSSHCRCDAAEAQRNLFSDCTSDASGVAP